MANALTSASSYQAERKLVAESLLPDDVYCEHHGRRCAQAMPDFHIAGPHCNEHSQQGGMAGKDGYTAKFFLAQCKLAKSRQIKLLVLENVTTGEFTEMVSDTQCLLSRGMASNNICSYTVCKSVDVYIYICVCL